MKKKLLIALGILAALVAGLVGFASTRPDTYHVERSIEMQASADTVFRTINDLHDWPRWSPWERLDPNMQRTFSGNPIGVGAIYEWKGNSDVGAGKMTITQSRRPTHVAMDLDFKEPFESRAKVTFTLAGQGENTRLTWAMDGEAILMSKLFGLFMNMDEMIGKDFEKGLRNLKELHEIDVPAADAPVATP